MKHDIYLRAAMEASNGSRHEDGACVLIAEASGEGMHTWKSNEQSVAFGKMFRPKRTDGPFWFDDYTVSLGEVRNRRVIALLFAHLMHLDGQLP